MGALHLVFIFVCMSCILRSDGQISYKDMFTHSHPSTSPPIHGWSPDSNPWDDKLYPPFKSTELKQKRGRSVIAHLTSDSPAMNGSCITFTTTLEFPKCQKEDTRGDLVYDEHCQDENGEVNSGYVYNWTSWLDDYSFGKCADTSRCNVFPDGTPFAQRSDWRCRNYVYVWHTMGQYFQTRGGSFSTLRLNTTNITLGAKIMEVKVYQSRSHRKYRPVATDSEVYFITDKIPLAVTLSQKKPANMSDNVFVKDLNITFNVLLHDPSKYLSTAAFVHFIWDFGDGNQLITSSDVATHAYTSVGNATVKLTVQAAFHVVCPPSTPTPTSFTSPRTTATTTLFTESHSATTTTETTPVGSPTTDPQATTTSEVTTGFNITRTFSSASKAALRHHHHVSEPECYRYMYGNFEMEIFIVDMSGSPMQTSKIVSVSATEESDATVNFLVTCLGSFPTSACTVISDHTCEQVKDVVCELVPPSEKCMVTLRRTFLQPGTYCVNISLDGSPSLTQARTQVTIGSAGTVSKRQQATALIVSAGAMLVALFGFMAFMMYRRHKGYQPVSWETREQRGQLWTSFAQLRAVLFQANGERSHLLNDPRPTLQA